METNPTAGTPADPTANPSGATAVKADLFKRFLAQFIDGIIAGVVFWVFIVITPGYYGGWFLGAIAGGAYFLVRDGLELDFMKHRSLGKKIMKLRPVRLDGQPMNLEASIKRNWMFAASYVGYVPTLGALGSLLSLAVAVIVLYECYKVITDQEGRRWGDELAETHVIETAD